MVFSCTFGNDFNVIDEAEIPFNSLDSNQISYLPGTTQCLAAEAEIMLVRPGHHIHVDNLAANPNWDIAAVEFPTFGWVFREKSLPPPFSPRVQDWNWLDS